MAKQLEIKICHLYPDIMDTYGDTGNIKALAQRAQKRNIKVTVTKILLGDKIKNNFYDFFFIGGGQDNAQIIVEKDFLRKKSALINSIENGSALLSICGGYQLLQSYFETKTGRVIKGMGLFDAFTKASSDRMIQNLLIKINPDTQAEINTIYKTAKLSNCPIGNLVGFENHSGKTYLGKNTKPLGYTLRGAGNNGLDNTEGAVYKNAFGCYMHGSLLPKNPHFADLLLIKSLEKRYSTVKLEPLNDDFEWHSHIQSTKITYSST